MKIINVVASVVAGLITFALIVVVWAFAAATLGLLLRMTWEMFLIGWNTVQ